MRRTFVTLLAVSALMVVAVGGWAVGSAGTEPPPRIAFLANGINPADALAAGAIAGQLGAPLFTTHPDALEPAAESGIVAYEPQLVIVLGGPVAISESVVEAVATSTGLTVQGAAGPTSGIVRVAGDDRYATAAAVADLLRSYHAAYLRVDSTAFARSATACPSGRFATGVDGSGLPICARPHGGNADQVDGLDGADLLTADPYTVQVTELIGSHNFGENPVIQRKEKVHVIDTTVHGGPVTMHLPVVLSGRGFSAVEVLDVTVCVASGASFLGGAAFELVDSETGVFYWTDSVEGVSFEDGACTVLEPAERYILDASVFPNINLRVSQGGTVDLRTITARLRPTNDPVNRDGPLEF